LLLQLSHVLSFSCCKLAFHYFSTLAEYFMYSPLLCLSCFMDILCCSEDEEFFDEDFL
jgi:hypothetical protein